MIVKVQASRKHASSFKRLYEYLTQERDAETGELLLRGDVVLSWNLLSFDTAAGEMQGVAALNDRCKDAVCHYELAWPPGERPTRPQWTDSAVQTLKALGYEHHQYMVVAHDDKKHFHIHIMVNKVHPQTLRAPTPYRNWLALDAAARLLEAKYGWAHTPGMTRWDEESKQAVPISRSERIALRSAREQPTGAAAQLEHYQDEESLQTYVRREVAPSVRKLLTRQNVTWDHLHRLLSKAHLRLEKGESGGYTVLAIDSNIRVKTSDVFRNNFAGKINRQNTETALGAWTPASTSGYEADQHGAQHAPQHNARNSALRDERKAQRRAERSDLMAEYSQYRNRRREACKAFTIDGREGRQYILDVLREQKREIRASALPWPDKKVLLVSGCGAIRPRSTISEAVHSTEAAGSNFRKISAHGSRKGPTKETRERPHNFADGVMPTNAISGGSTQGWNQTHCISVHLPMTTATPIGPTSQQQRLVANSRLLPIRLP